MDKSDPAATHDWLPPTPRSQLVPLPTSTLPVDHLVLLPPPLLSHPSYTYPTPTSPFPPPPPASRRPSLPSLQTFLSSSSSTMSSLPASNHSAGRPSRSEQEQNDARLAASLAERPETCRPRRSAAITAAARIPRQPSPFDLEDDGGGEPYAAEDDEEDEDAHSDSGPASSSSRKRSATGAGGTAGGGGAAGASKRKVSHSLIERRRREKINQCLQSLKEMVPSLREEGEKKLAKARERGRKRGRGDDAGERGGLHKLEILQGSIAYIEDLRAQLAQLQRSPSYSMSSTAQSPPAERAARQAPTPSPDSLESESTPSFTLPSPIMRASITTALEMSIRHPVDFNLAGSKRGAELPVVGGGVVDDHEASLLLLNFSTSPELRPVQM